MHDSVYMTVSKIVKLIEAESRMVVARGCGTGKWEVVVKCGSKVSVMLDE